MIDQLIELDKKLLIYLNSFHADWLDPIMLQITKTEFWVPLYLFIIYLIFRTYNDRAWLYMAGAALAILIADQFTASLMKPFFERLRPSQDPTLNTIIHLATNGDGEPYRGGLYGFASSHAANTFATALFSTLVLRDRYRWIGLVFIWAAAMTYTRIYLGVHFPGDILVGGMVGLCGGYAGYRLSKWLVARADKKKALTDEASA